MKYVLKNTAYRPDTGTVEELYIRNIEGLCTKKLCDAMVWDDFDDLAYLVESDPTWDVKIVQVTEKELFESRLQDK